jgi:hypothetical protein
MKHKLFIFVTVIFLMSGLSLRAITLHDSIPPGKNFEKALFRIWYPDGLKSIRGIVVIVPGSNGDGRSETGDKEWQTFAIKNDLALLGCYFTDYPARDMFIEKYINVSQGSGQALLDVLKKFAVTSGHRELAAAPLLLWGMSAGGEFNYEFTCWHPDRVIAFVVNKGGIYYTALAPEAARAVPGILFTGEKDLDARTDIIKGLFSMNRRAGALWVYAQEPGSAHEVGQTIRLARIYFDEVLPLRMSSPVPAGTDEKLLPLSESSGYLGDHKTQTISSVSDGLKYEYPVSWFPGKNSAEAWKAFVMKKPF